MGKGVSFRADKLGNIWSLGMVGGSRVRLAR